MRNPMADVQGALRALAAGATVAVLALTLAACGDEPSGNASESDSASAQDREDAMLEFARCMREHGVDMPDPEPDGGMVIQGEPGDEEVIEAAQEACQEHLEDTLPEGVGPDIPAEQKEALLAAAQCMRDRGWDVPDPQFDGGRVTQRMEADAGLDPEDPAFQQDQQECAADSGVEMPAGRPGR